MLCPLCETSFDPTETDVEHIIPFALGGQLKSRQLVCTACNRQLGKTIDKPVADLLDFHRYSLRRISKRYKGPRSIRGTLPGNTDVLVTDEGKVEPLQRKVASGQELHYIATSMEELERILKKRIARSGADISVQEVIEKSDLRKRQIKRTPVCHLDGDIYPLFRCATRICFFYLLHRYGDVHAVDESVIECLKDDRRLPPVAFFYRHDGILKSSEESVYHKIGIRSYPSHQLLLGFVDLYSTFSFVVYLCRKHHENLESCYAYDLLKRQEEIASAVTMTNLDEIPCFHAWQVDERVNQLVQAKSLLFSMKVLAAEKGIPLDDVSMDVWPDGSRWFRVPEGNEDT